MMISHYEQMNHQKNDPPKKIRIAAYCRVSTDHEDQANSFESQQRYFRHYTEQNPDWILYRIFADEGISGTSTKKRTAFNQMIASAKKGAFDLILTKEISRFARNTLDSIYFTRELKKLGIGVIFMNDNINTLDGDSELRLAIMSSIAQEESRKTSERVKWGQRRQMEQGIVFGRSMLGYDIQNGVMQINEEGAKIVRTIFHKFLDEGKGVHVIAKELLQEGIKPMRAAQWQDSVILRILRNEKYCGDLVQKKTYTPDYLSHEKKYNKGEEEFIIQKNHHEPIISRERFDLVNKLLDERSLSQLGKPKYSVRYPFSGKIKCGLCQSSYIARKTQRKDGSDHLTWRCQEANKNGRPHKDPGGNEIGCEGKAIGDKALLCVMQRILITLPLDKVSFAKELCEQLSSAAPEGELGADQVEKVFRETMRLLTEQSDDGSFYAQLISRIIILDDQQIAVYLQNIEHPFRYQIL